MHRYEFIRALRKAGITAAVSELITQWDYVPVTRDSFLAGCVAALAKLDAEGGLDVNRGGQSAWNCDPLSWAVSIELRKWHALSAEGENRERALAVGVLPYEDKLLGRHQIVFASDAAGNITFFDPTRNSVITPDADELSMAPTFYI